MPATTDAAPIASALHGLVLGEPLTCQALTVVPLIGHDRPEPGWLTLDEAGEAVAVGEVGEGWVPNLQVVNHADRPVLLLDGEELIGARQNRVLNTTVLVAAHSSVTIPVSCVERGRWAFRARRATAGLVSLYASLRARKAAAVTRALAMDGGHSGDQQAIWQALDDRAARHGVKSATAAMHDFYARHQEHVARAREVLAALPGQVGAIVYLSGRWLGMELLASPGLFARAWGRLAAGYAADALGQPQEDGLWPDPLRVLRRVERARSRPAPAVGLGREHRFTGPRVHGAVLVVDGRVAHLMAFAGEASGTTAR